MLERWRRRALVAVLLYVVGLVLWTVRPWSDTQPLVVPAGVGAIDVEYRCPAVFGGEGEPEPRDPAPYPPADEPCDQRNSLRLLSGVDLGVAGAALVVLWRVGQRRRVGLVADDEDEPVPAPTPTSN